MSTSEAQAEAQPRPAPSPKKTQQKTKGGKQQGGAGGGGGGAPRVIEIAPMATRSRMETRHYAILLSFLFLVLAPLGASAWYLWTRATDQYASISGFTVRREDGGTSSDLLGGVAAQIGTGGAQADNDILFEFIQSQELVARIDAEFDLAGLYSTAWARDPVFGIWPDATIEDLVWYWGRIARVSYDQSSGLIDMRLLAFDAETARAISRAVLADSQEMINALNATARQEAVRFATDELERAASRLRGAREALVLFRTRTQIVDLETDLQGRLGVVNNLQQQLAAALVERDILADQGTGQSTGTTDPRLAQAARRIDVIRARIAQERANVTTGRAAETGEDFPTLLAEYEGLLADREFAEESYRAALTALDIANTNAQRQSRYLAVFVNPTLPERAEFPQRWVLFGLVALFLVLVWSILLLIVYSVRDSR